MPRTSGVGSFEGDWSNEQIETLIKLWGENEGVRRIAVKCGHTADAVYKKRAKLGLPAREKRGTDEDNPWPPYLDTRLKLDWTKGVAIKVIAQRLDKTWRQVDQRRKALGLPLRRPRKAPVKLIDMSVRVPKDMHRKIGQRAMVEGMSTAAWVRRACEVRLG